jgi:CheY-like chemotaxis protein
VRLLYVENHAVFAETVIEQFLDDHDVTLCASIAAARAAIDDAPPFDAVLLDYDLDDGKGDALAEHLRRSGFRGRIIAVSSHDEGNAAILRAGADVVCAKTSFERIAGTLHRES